MSGQCTAPLNIVKNTQNQQICKLKCAYQFAYAHTRLQIYNLGWGLLLYTDQTAIPPVIYNDQNYNILQVVLMSPSIHTYNGNRANAELIIYHVNTTTQNKYLVVCVPIKQSSTSTATSATFFDSIMNSVTQNAAAGGVAIYNDATFSMSSFIPLAPFYAYTGTDSLFNPSCTKNMIQMDYIVFHSDNAITMSPQAFRSLRQVNPSRRAIPPAIDQSRNPGGLFYNPDGPIRPNKGDIYIDCRPTGDDGEVLVPARQDTSSIIDSATATKFLNFTFIKILIGIILMIMIWKLMIKAVKGITGSSTKAPGVGGAKIN